MRNIPPSQAPWTPPQERLDGERLNAIDALRSKLKEAEARQTDLAAEVGANARSIAELSKRIEQLREDMPKMLTGAGGGKRTIRKVMERDGSEWLPDIVEPIVAPLVGPAVNTALSAAIGVTIQGYDPDLAAWALVNPSQFSTTVQIAASYQPLSSVLTNTTASFTSALLTKLNGIASGATANDTDANLKNRANHTGTQLASTISDFSTAADARISTAIGVSVQAYSANLNSWAAVAPSSYLTTAAAASTYQPLDAQLTDVAAVTPTADQFLGGNGSNLVMRTAAQVRTSLSLVVGTNVQAQDARLQALAGLDSTAGLLEQTGATAFTKRAMGVAASTSVLTRADGDARYQAVETTGTWTPALVPATPGTFSATWTTQQGRWFRVGNWVEVTFWLAGTFTVGTASGYVTIQGLSAAGFTCRAGATNAYFMGSMRYNDITRAGYTQFIPAIAAGTSNISIECMGSGSPVDRLAINHINGAGSPILIGHLRFPV